MSEIINYKDCTIRISADEYPENPRKEFDNVGIMVCFHNSYDLGDEESKNYNEPIDLLYELAEIDRNEHLENNDNDLDFADLYKVIEEKGYIIKPLYLYDHSGITISTGSFSCPWDSGMVGWIYATPEAIKEEDWTKEQADKYLEGEVTTFDDYLTCNVWGFIVEDENGEQIGSCSGFYGDTKYCIEEAQSSIDSHLKHRFLREGKQLKFEFA